MNALRDWFVRTMIFNHRKRSLFLKVVASQLESGRPYADIFRSLQKASNGYYRRLARLSIHAEAEYFASGYGPYFGQRTTVLLTLAQRYNVVPEFINGVILNRPAGLSLWRSVVLKSPTEILICLLFIAGAVTFYLYGDFIQATFGDFSGTYLYMTGETLYVYRAPLIVAAAAAIVSYVYFRGREHYMRGELKSVGSYHFHDRLFVIDLFRVIAIMTSSAGKGQDTSSSQLVAELEAVFATDGYRKHQFKVMREALGEGNLLQDAIEAANLLGPEELDLFKGLTPHESLEEIHVAAGAVERQLADKTRLEMAFLGSNVQFGCLIFIGLATVAIIDITMGGGNVAINEMNQF